MNIQILGAHNCESKDTRLSSLLVDDCLVLDAGGLTSCLSFLTQRILKAIMLTHQHYDHIRDIPAIAMNLYLAGDTIDIYSTLPVYDTLTTYLMNGELYPDFLERPPENPTIQFTVIEPLETWQIEGYSILAIPVNHSVPTVGYQITSTDGNVLFYTGDTGPDLIDCFKQISPQLLIIDVTASNKFEEFSKESRHLTPSLLKQELTVFRELKGYLPRVVTIHMSPSLEEEIRTQIAVVAKDLNCSITLGYEGMRLHL
ncbi:MBL fold metallo-hydrolase [Chloroflexota bacterium]